MKLNIKPILKKRGIRQAKLATELDISPGYMSLLINGDRDPSHAILTKMAEVLEVAVGDLFDPQPIATGFAEQVEPFKTPETELQAICKMMAATPRTPTLYRLKQHCGQFNLSRGDTLLVDLNADLNAGDLVIATEIDETGSGTSLIALWADPWVITDPTGGTPRKTDDDGRISILGKIVGSLRGLAA
ncbi:helix-turn-helix transcriptional regulator [Thalassovita sp.]|uniref:helix-turn-helix transcriptional regulator n=1 Tax=Thalassovita sp. TaxID=1979401 RepID=UPI002882C308|nr:helix-turn-helix transcriptional regulator [Thalassovita sp.]MDF1801707.1 helix-turn-helix transcriptional regulator [Thalassovita sp.]